MSYYAALKLGFKKWVAKIIAYYSFEYDWSTNPSFHFNPYTRWLAAFWLSSAIKKAYKGSLISASRYLGYALHSIQDSYAHIGPFWKHRRKWDYPGWRPYRYQRAKRATQKFLLLFKRSLPKWLRKAYCY
jgi:hypothetical protein